MYKDDNKLEEALGKSEVEQDLQASKSAGTPENEEISSLVSLAVSIRDLSHPEQGAETVRAEKRRILAAARNKRQKQRSFGWSRNGGFTGQWMVLPAVAGAALLVLMVFVLAAGAGLYFSGPRGAQAATLTSGSGVVEVLNSDGSGGWITVSDGQRVKSGQRLRTGADSQVTLTFFEGTQVTLDPNTDLMLSQVAGDWGKKLQVAMIQNEGETSHQVVPLQGAHSAYSVMTPSGEASVKGTSFKVLVEETGNSVFTVETGAVLVSNNGEEAFLAAGQGVITELGKPLDAPNYLFAIQGVLDDASGKTWSVEGIPFTVKGGTRIEGNPHKGALVLVNGRITKKNEWIADSIQSAISSDRGGTFTGVVTGVSEDGVDINGYPFDIRDEQPEVNEGDLVRVQFMIDDGTWVVLNLAVLESRGTDDPDLDPDPPLEPETELYFDPEEGGATTCEQVEPFETTLHYQNSDEEAVALGVSLVVTEVKGQGYIKTITFSPEGSFLIDPDGEVLISINVELIDTLAELPPESEVEIKISVWDELAEEFIGDSYELKWECDQELPEEEDPDDDDDGDKCTRDKQHPHALTLAAVYGDRVGVDYGQIWTWFCEDNLGFGEIELAFKLYLEYGEVLGLDIYDIIDMRLDGGFGWGQIKQQLKQAERSLLGDEASEKKVPPGKEKSEEAKNKDKPKKKDD